MGIAVRLKPRSLHIFQRALKTGPLAIELIDHHRARQNEFVGKGPDLLGLHFHASDAVDDHQSRIGRNERSPRVIDKNVEAGSVYKVDLLPLPLGGSDGGSDCDFARNLFLIEVRDGLQALRSTGR